MKRITLIVLLVALGSLSVAAQATTDITPDFFPLRQIIIPEAKTFNCIEFYIMAVDVINVESGIGPSEITMKRRFDFN